MRKRPLVAKYCNHDCVEVSRRQVGGRWYVTFECRYCDYSYERLA